MNPVLGALTKIGTKVPFPSGRGTDPNAAATAERVEAFLALTRELFHALEQFVISTPDLDTQRFLQRMRSTAAGLTGTADIPTLRLYANWVRNSLGKFGALQRRCVCEREDEMWRLLDALAQASHVGANSENRLITELRESHGRMREYVRLEDVREARLHMEEEIRKAQKLVELKAREDRERLAALQRQVTRLEAALASVKGQADYDVLTGVYHRGVFDQKLRFILEEGHSCTLALIDIDNFKTINDTLGHAVGDKILTLVGENLHRVARTTDLPARYGGDEFAFIAGGFTSEQLAQRLSGALARRHVRMEMEEGDGQERVIQVLLSISVGIAASKGHDTPNSLIMRADQALAAAKKSGKGGVRVAL